MASTGLILEVARLMVHTPATIFWEALHWRQEEGSVYFVYGRNEYSEYS